MAGFFNNPRQYLTDLITPKKALTNVFNEAFFAYLGGGWTRYDHKGLTYIDKGYNENPDVFAIVSQIARKFSSVPGILKEVKDAKSAKQLKSLYAKSLSPQEFIKKIRLETKAFGDDMKEIDDPMERPNYYQSETEYQALWETFMLLTGNAYQWILSPSDGINAGRPIERFLLPAHLVQIVVRDNWQGDMNQDPISHYIILIGNTMIRFEREDVIHSRFPNPNYDLSGSHLYGHSPVKAALRDLQLSNATIDHNNSTMNNGGVYGFIHAKDGQTPLTNTQAEELKSRLIQMQGSKDALGRIAGASAPLGFTQVSVDTDKMQPHTYSDAAQKHIANCLGWSTLLLNTDAKYDNLDAAWIMAISNRISPDLQIYEDALNTYYYPRFKELKNAKITFDVSELPEMQGDMKELCEWLSIALDNGAISPDEFRVAIKYPALNTPEMKQHYLKSGLTPIEDVAVNDQSVDRAFNIDKI